MPTSLLIVCTERIVTRCYSQLVPSDTQIFQHTARYCADLSICVG